MRKAKSLVTRVTTCGEIAPANDPEHPWSNFTAFKAKFGGAEFHLVPLSILSTTKESTTKYTTMFARVPGKNPVMPPRFNWNCSSGLSFVSRATLHSRPAR